MILRKEIGRRLRLSDFLSAYTIILEANWNNATHTEPLPLHSLTRKCLTLSTHIHTPHLCTRHTQNCTHSRTHIRTHTHALPLSISLPVCRSGLSLPPSLKKGYFHISTSYQLLHFCPIIDQVFSFFNSPRLLLGGCRITMGYTI